MEAKNILLAITGAAFGEADFERFYRAELPRVYNFFCYRLGDGPLAEDLTAETFEKVWRKRDQYRRDLAAFSTWVFTIARRVAQDYYRAHPAGSPRAALSLEEIRDVPGSVSTEDLAEQNADFAHLTILLARLADRDRELVALKYGAGLTNRAIAQLSGLSESNVGVILYRAIQILRSEWEGTP